MKQRVAVVKLHHDELAAFGKSLQGSREEPIAGAERRPHAFAGHVVGGGEGGEPAGEEPERAQHEEQARRAAPASDQPNRSSVGHVVG